MDTAIVYDDMTTSSTKRVADKADESSAADVPGPGEPDLSGDWCNFFLLLLLYTIQGLPLGLTVQAMPVLLQSNKNVDYDDQVRHVTRNGAGSDLSGPEGEGCM